MRCRLALGGDLANNSDLSARRAGVGLVRAWWSGCWWCQRGREVGVGWSEQMAVKNKEKLMKRVKRTFYMKNNVYTDVPKNTSVTIESPHIYCYFGICISSHFKY